MNEFRNKLIPEDGTYVGRVWVPAGFWNYETAGPCVVVIQNGNVYDASRVAGTCSDFMKQTDLAGAVAQVVAQKPVMAFSVIPASIEPADIYGDTLHLLPPVDLQCLKAAGVTFVNSMLERVIEEKAKGDPEGAAAVREEFTKVVGGSLSSVVPGSKEAAALKEKLISLGWWSAYLEVGIGDMAEIFTKGQVMSAVGPGMEVGLHPASSWNNPEPEVVLVVTPDNRIVGATLGNDVNLRDIEGRSALLLGRAKDNNASCSIGPFIRLIDDTFTLDSIRSCDVSLRVEGEDEYVLEDTSTMRAISRDIEDLVSQCSSRNHQYPDGFVLFTGTLFAPTQDRGVEGQGFTHHLGDIVEIASHDLGMLRNRVTTSDRAPAWTYGISSLYASLRARSLPLGTNNDSSSRRE